jgi:hypothetical protein
VKDYTFTARIEDGRLKVGLRTLEAMRQALTQWQRCPVTITVEKQHAIRNVDQNALYWAGYVNPVAEYTGYTPRQIHALFKKMFLPKERIEIVDKRSGVVTEVDLDQLSTTQLNKIEFSDYLHEIKEWVDATFHGTVTVGSNRAAA